MSVLGVLKNASSIPTGIGGDEAHPINSLKHGRDYRENLHLHLSARKIHCVKQSVIYCLLAAIVAAHDIDVSNALLRVTSCGL